MKWILCQIWFNDMWYMYQIAKIVVWWWWAWLVSVYISLLRPPLTKNWVFFGVSVQYGGSAFGSCFLHIFSIHFSHYYYFRAGARNPGCQTKEEKASTRLYNGKDRRIKFIFFFAF
jgi:hypothetical protein